jgi:hypothetical protein
VYVGCPFPCAFFPDLLVLLRTHQTDDILAYVLDLQARFPIGFNTAEADGGNLVGPGLDEAEMDVWRKRVKELEREVGVLRGELEAEKISKREQFCFFF